MENLIEKCKVMMNYLGLDNFVVPHFNIDKVDLPIENKDWTCLKIFKFYKNGTFSYKAWDDNDLGNNYKVIAFGIDPGPKLIQNCYNYLSMDVRARVLRQTKHEVIPNLAILFLAFNKLSFIKLTKDDLLISEYV